LAGKGYLPMIFDFERPDSFDLIDAVVTMAGLSKFVIADLSGPRVPGEVQAILRARQLPVLAFGDPDTIAGLEHDTNGVTIAGDDAALGGGLARALQALEQLHLERVTRLAQECAAVQPPPPPASVA